MSDNPQLDKYLTYLLTQEHPHKFMYYPGWTLTVAGCAAVAAFLRRDKRIKVMTLSSNKINDDGRGGGGEGGVIVSGHGVAGVGVGRHSNIVIRVWVVSASLDSVCNYFCIG